MDVHETYRVLIVVHSLSQNRAEWNRGESSGFLPHSSDLKQGPKGWWGEQGLVRVNAILPNRIIKQEEWGGSRSYAACRWDSCWPGNAACLRRSCRDTGVCRAGWGCLAGPTDTQHTRCCCRCSHHLTAAWREESDSDLTHTRRVGHWAQQRKAPL